jgi:hypothetical protein
VGIFHGNEHINLIWEMFLWEIMDYGFLPVTSLQGIGSKIIMALTGHEK